jgi:hypothetical protein
MTVFVGHIDDSIVGHNDDIFVGHNDDSICRTQ